MGEGCLVYHIGDGSIYAPDGSFMGTGYSGAGKLLEDGRNNVSMCCLTDKGPIPPGAYSIGPSYLSKRCGPITMDLNPIESTNAFGRSEFRIHGDNTSHNASHGCIVLGPLIRREIAIKGYQKIRVVP